jgi:protein TonB
MDRRLNFAVVSSLALHAALLFGVSTQRETAKRDAPPPLLEARLVEPPAPPPPPSAAPQPEVAKPAAKPLPKKRAPRPKPAPEPPKEAAPAPAPVIAEPAPPAPPAPPSIAKVEPRPAPAAPSTEQLEALSRAQYQKELLDAARRFKRYPALAQENNWEGEVQVRMVIGADGAVSLSIQRSSTHAVLDRQALDMFKRAHARVALPPVLRGKEVTLELRAVYNLKDQGSG